MEVPPPLIKDCTCPRQSPSFSDKLDEQEKEKGAILHVHAIKSARDVPVVRQIGPFGRIGGQKN